MKLREVVEKWDNKLPHGTNKEFMQYVGIDPDIADDEVAVLIAYYGEPFIAMCLGAEWCERQQRKQ